MACTVMYGILNTAAPASEREQKVVVTDCPLSRHQNCIASVKRKDQTCHASYPSRRAELMQTLNSVPNLINRQEKPFSPA